MCLPEMNIFVQITKVSIHNVPENALDNILMIDC